MSPHRTRLIVAFSVLSLALAGIGAAVPSAVAQEQQQQPQPPQLQINASGWQGAAFLWPDSREFGYCLIQRPFENGVTVIFRTTSDYQTDIGFANQEWSLPEGEEFTARLQIDNTFDQQFPAAAVQPEFFIVGIGTNEQLIELLKRGSTLTVTTPNVEASVPLSGTFDALAQLRECVNTANQLVNQLATEGEGAPQGPPGMGEDALRRILEDHAGLEDVTITSREDLPEEQQQFQHIWRAGPLQGALFQQPRPDPADVNMDAFADWFIGRLEETCEPGVFEKTVEPTTVLQDSFALKRASVQCATETETRFASLFFTLDSYFYSVFLHETDPQHREQAQQVAANIETFARQLAEASAPADGTTEGN